MMDMMSGARAGRLWGRVQRPPIPWLRLVIFGLRESCFEVFIAVLVRCVGLECSSLVLIFILSEELGVAYHVLSNHSVKNIPKSFTYLSVSSNIGTCELRA